MGAEVNILELKRAVRGYDPGDVDRLIATLSHRLEKLENERSEKDRLVQKLTRDLGEAQDRAARLKRAK
jgi:cell division septum initiation protein DivIVA